MKEIWHKDYPLLSVTEAELDENNSLKKLLNLVGEDKQVLDFGCATGYLARLLLPKRCRVTGIEVNSQAAEIAEQYCEKVIVADLDFVSLEELLPTHAFDVAVFGDILEHLRNPWRVLEATRQVLKPEGYVVASIPNIAHGAIRLALLQGRFEYAQLGILEDTHLRFFTRQTVEQLFEQSGYFLELIERTKLPIFADSPLIPAVHKADFAPEMIEQVEQEPEADTLQFVVRAFPLTLEGKYAALEEKHRQTVEELARLKTQLKQAQAAWNETQTQLHQAQEEWSKAQGQLQQLLPALEEAKSQIRAMETSKFWKLRRVWLRAKKTVGLSRDEAD